MSNIHCIKTQSDLENSIEKLIKIEPKFNLICDIVDIPNLDRKLIGFESIFRNIVSQQLSSKAAESIHSRLIENNLNNPANIKTATDEDLRSMGLSHQKIKYVRALVEANINYPQLENCTNDEVIEELTKVKGVGRWTAEIYLIYSLKRSDVIPIKDLAIQKSIIHLMKLDENTNLEVLRKISNNWIPYRTTASLLLWKYYGYLKSIKAF